MGNGAMLGKLRSPRLVQLTGSRARDESAPVVGRACEDARQGAEFSVDTGAGVASVKCTRCSASRALPYGTVAFTCQACGSDVRVSLSTMSSRAKADVKSRLQKAEHIVRSTLEEQASSCKQLCEGVKKVLSEEEEVWGRQPPDSSEAARDRVLIRAAVGAHDWAHAEEMLEHWKAIGHPLVSERLQAALSSLRNEDELESLWRRAVNALTAREMNSVDLEFWSNEASLKSVCVPAVVKDVIQALRGQERAIRAEEEYQAQFKARVTEARIRDDTASLKALAMEAKLLGEDSSAVDAVLEPVKSYRRKRSEESREDTEAAATSSMRSCSIKRIKEELAKRGISAAGVLEKDELTSLLERGTSRYAPGAEATDGSKGDGPSTVPSCRVPYAPPSPTGNPSTFNPKPPVGPRPRRWRAEQPPSGMPSEESNPQRASSTGEESGRPRSSRGSAAFAAGAEALRGSAAFASAFAHLWSGHGESANPSCPSKTSTASTKPQASDDGTATGTPQRPARPSSASAKPYTYPEVPAGETPTPMRRPSSASVYGRSPGPSEAPSAHRTSVPSGSSSARGTSAHRSCEPPSYRPSRFQPGSASTGTQNNAEGCGVEAVPPKHWPPFASAGGVGIPLGHEPPPFTRPGRPASASARPPPAEARGSEPGSSPRPDRPSFRPPSYADGLGADSAAPQRRPSSASRGTSKGPARASSQGPSQGAASSTPTVNHSGRPSSASATPQQFTYDYGPATPQRPARPSSASRAASNQDAASPRPARASSPWARRDFTTPSAAERMPSKRNSSMPPRPPWQSPRPERTPGGGGAQPEFSNQKGSSLPCRSATPTIEAALTCLGLKGTPTGEEIRRAYKQAALQCHPDRPQNHGCAEEAKANFQEVKAAFDLLQAPDRRTAPLGGG